MGIHLTLFLSLDETYVNLLCYHIFVFAGVKGELVQINASKSTVLQPIYPTR